MQIVIRPEGERWFYEVHASETNPFRHRLLGYLQREGLIFQAPPSEGQPLHIGPLYPEQAYAFENHWRPFVIASGQTTPGRPG